MRMRAISLVVSLLMVLSAPGAFADEGDGETPELNATAQTKVALLADFVAGDPFDEVALATATETVTDMRTSGIGWCALMKIYKLAAALGVDPGELVGEIGADGEFDFGEIKNSLTDSQRAAYEDMPKNFGTLKAAEMKADKASEMKAEKAQGKADRKAERDAGKSEKKNVVADDEADEAEDAAESDD